MDKLKNKVFLAKGKRSVVYSAMLGRKKVVVKEKSSDSSAIGRMENEAVWLKKLNPLGIGPKFCSSGKDFVIMAYVPGIRILEWIPEHSRQEIRAVMLDILKQCRKLDELSANKEEMHNPYKHILVRSKKATMIDFERCRFVVEPQNVSQFCQFLMSANVNRMLQNKGITLDKENLISILKHYKKTHSNFNEVLKALSL